MFLCYNYFGDIMNPNTVNVLVLAYLGDNVYEYYVRKYLINKHGDALIMFENLKNKVEQSG